MICNTESDAIVKLEHLYFNEIEFGRSEVISEEADLKIHFAKHYDFNQSGNACKVSLSCFIRDVDETVFSIKVTITGIFSCDCEDLEKRDTLLRKNTLSILLPYLRSQITLVTAQPDMTPIILPPINVEALFDNSPENNPAPGE